MASHHLADGILGSVGDELQACDERRTKAVLSRKLDQLSQFANRPGLAGAPDECSVEQSCLLESASLIIDRCLGFPVHRELRQWLVFQDNLMNQ